MNLSGNWLNELGAQTIFQMFNSAGYNAYFVGGCVRNALLGAPINDIDIATDAVPSCVLELAAAAQIRAVETGAEHGTITLIIDQTPYEVTTYRRDIETDGRRAVVSFSTNIEDDARRRDFTMNALYADSAGAVVDPLSGLPDLIARRVRFIENADDRIKEDYLRVLRFFRFYAWYGDQNAGIDAEGLAACGVNLDGLETLAKERVGAEMLKLLAATDPAPAVASMAQSGVLNALITGSDSRQLPILVHFEEEYDTYPNPLRRLALLGGSDVPKALRLSKKDTTAYELLRAELSETRSPSELGYRYGELVALDILLLRAAVFEAPPLPNISTELARGAAQELCIRAADLMPRLEGADLGRALRGLEKQWIASGFALTRSELLDLARKY